MKDAWYEITRRVSNLFVSESHLERKERSLIYSRRVFCDSRIFYRIIIAAFPPLTHHFKRSKEILTLFVIYYEIILIELINFMCRFKGDKV